MKGTASKSENKITAIMAIFIMILVFIGFKNGSFQPKEGTPITQVTVDKSVVPGSCLVLEEKYCRMVKKSVDDYGNTSAIFKLPAGVPIFSPYAGMVSIFLNGLPKGVIVSKDVRHPENWMKAKSTFIIDFTGYSEDGIKDGDQVRKGEILARTGERNVTGAGAHIGANNLVMYFAKDGLYTRLSTIDNVLTKAVFGIS